MITGHVRLFQSPGRLQLVSTLGESLGVALHVLGPPRHVARAIAEFHVDPDDGVPEGLRDHAEAVARYAVTAVRDAATVLGHRTFLLDDLYVRPICIKGHGRGAQVVYHHAHEPPDMERKVALGRFMRDAVAQTDFRID